MGDAQRKDSDGESASKAKRSTRYSTLAFHSIASALQVAWLLPTACNAASPRDTRATASASQPVAGPSAVGPLHAHAAADTGQRPASVFSLHQFAEGPQPSVLFPRRTGTPVALVPEPVVSTCDVETVENVVHNIDAASHVTVAIALAPAPARAFEEFTARNVGHPLAIVVDGVVVSAPIIRVRIVGGYISIEAGSIGEANDLVRRIRAREECR